MTLTASVDTSICDTYESCISSSFFVVVVCGVGSPGVELLLLFLLEALKEAHSIRKAKWLWRPLPEIILIHNVTMWETVMWEESQGGGGQQGHQGQCEAELQSVWRHDLGVTEGAWPSVYTRGIQGIQSEAHGKWSV